MASEADDQKMDTSVPEKASEKASEDATEEPPTKKVKSDEEAAEKAVVEKPENGTQEDKEEEPKKYVRPVDLAKFWKTVEDDPKDFTGWTYLLQFVDANAQYHEGQEAFDAFLHRYPYCYGYWKKYADFEKKKGTKETTVAVFERGLKAIPLSADLWIHYMAYVKSEYDPSFIRAQYERAVGACGREWRSDKLWDNYVKWEKELNNFSHVLRLYDRIIRNPTQGLGHQFEMFKDFVKEQNPKNFMDDTSFLALRREILEELKKSREDKKKDEKDDEKKEEDNAPGEDADKDDIEANIHLPSTDEENQAIREKIIYQRKKVFKETEEKVKNRWKFEDLIKRPYFHMKPLERGQLKTWNDYLDFEIEEQAKEGGDETVVEILFERCLIACALYEEFWLKYVKWLQTSGKSNDKVRDVFTRGTTHHLPNKTEIHIQFAAWEEKVGEYERAVIALKKIENEHPEMMSLVLRRINLERRRKNYDVVHELYQECIEKGKSAIKADLAVKYSRFLRFQLADGAKARGVIENQLEADEKNAKLYLQLLDILLHTQPLSVEDVTALLDRAMKNVKEPKQELLFSQRKVEFLEDFGFDVEALSAAQEAHAKIAKKAKDAAAKSENKDPGSSIKTIEGRGGNKTNGSSSTTYAAATNSASYNAQHTSQYQQYGSRYNSYGGSGGYGGSYGSYYQGGGPGGYGSGGYYGAQ